MPLSLAYYHRFCGRTLKKETGVLLDLDDIAQWTRLARVRHSVDEELSDKIIGRSGFDGLSSPLHPQANRPHRARIPTKRTW